MSWSTSLEKKKGSGNKSITCLGVGWGGSCLEVPAWRKLEEVDYWGVSWKVIPSPLRLPYSPSYPPWSRKYPLPQYPAKGGKPQPLNPLKVRAKWIFLPSTYLLRYVGHSYVQVWRHSSPKVKHIALRCHLHFCCSGPRRWTRGAHRSNRIRASG